MGDLRVKFIKLVRPSASLESEAGPTLSLGKEEAIDDSRKGKISDWSEAETLRKLTAMRVGVQGNHSFQGLKHHAFQRMVQYGKKTGDVTVIVLPVSPTYAKEFLTADLARQFESSLADIERDVPSAHWVRLDHMAALNTNDNFCDLVHMNVSGQQMTTDAFLKSR